MGAPSRAKACPACGQCTTCYKQYMCSKLLPEHLEALIAAGHSEAALLAAYASVMDQLGLSGADLCEAPANTGGNPHACLKGERGEATARGGDGGAERSSCRAVSGRCCS
jgi:hypothetical protein